MTSYLLLAVEVLAILCSQSEVCTVVLTSLISVQSSHFTQANLGRKKALPGWLFIRATYSCRQFPRRIAFLNSLSHKARLLSTVMDNVEVYFCLLLTQLELELGLSLAITTTPTPHVPLQYIDI